ncbi:MAG: hypothetical protein ACJ796_05540 [Gemmatimonadaceae bacterium]
MSATSSSSAPLSGSIYDGFSPRGQRALADLRAAFKDTGFYAEKERWTERTLRVYPERRAKYPLLNPGLAASRQGRPIRVEHPSIICPLYSDGDEGISRLLRAMPAIDGCRFTPGARRIGRYHLHGAFVLPLSFIGSPRQQIIDFTPNHAVEQIASASK